MRTKTGIMMTRLDNTTWEEEEGFTDFVASLNLEDGRHLELGWGPLWATLVGNKWYLVNGEGIGGWADDHVVDYYKMGGGTVSMFPTASCTLAVGEIEAALTDDVKDLADAVRTFGRRLDENVFSNARYIRGQLKE